jgi:hypothetical protein
MARGRRHPRFRGQYLFRVESPLYPDRQLRNDDRTAFANPMIADQAAHQCWLDTPKCCSQISRSVKHRRRETMEFNWRPGIGDPTIGGWVTVVLYFLACVSCWTTAGVVYDRAGQGDMYAWRAISVAFFALGINKQLDLQTALTEWGRILAFAGGWYEQRQIVQVYFIIGVTVVSLIAALALLFWARRSPVQTWLAILGSIFVLGYVLIRAASFHHIASSATESLGSNGIGFWKWAESRSYFLGANCAVLDSAACGIPNRRSKKPPEDDSANRLD